MNYQVIILVEAAGAASSTLQYPTLENTNHEQALSLSFIDNFIIIIFIYYHHHYLMIIIIINRPQSACFCQVLTEDPPGCGAHDLGQLLQLFHENEAVVHGNVVQQS